MKYIILIPAYQPDEKLIELLKIINKEYETIIVDDGSGEDYEQVFSLAKKYSKVISYKENMGKGYALKKGIEYIKNNYDNYIIVTMDCDMQHTLKDAINLCNYAKNHLDILVLGKRTWNRKTPLRSRIGNRITRFVFRMFTKTNIYDTQTGLRAFSYKLTDYMLNNEGNRFEYEMNVLLNLKKNNVLYHEIPIETIYIDNNKSSHFKMFKDSYRIYKNIFNWKKNN